MFEVNPTGPFAALTPALVGALLAGILVGVSAHELTHWATARLLGCPATISLRGWKPCVLYEVPVERGFWVERVVGLAPIASGLVGAAAWIAVVGPPTGPYAPAVGLGWVIFALGGGLEDYSVATAHGRGMREQPTALRRFTACFGLFVVGIAGSRSAHWLGELLGTNEAAARTFVVLINQVSIAFILLAVIALLLAIRHTDDIPPAHPLRTSLGDLLA